MKISEIQTKKQLFNHDQRLRKLEKNGVIGNSKLYYVTPQMFGAVADGVTDDTVAVQAALDEGGIIYFPAGRYKVTSQLSVTKPSTIRMHRQYPSVYLGDWPKTNEDNWMGARIETYSPTNGIVIGDSVCLDGFYIRAMAGFGSQATASSYGGKGIVLQYDGALGYKTYPSSVRLSHIRVDIDTRNNEAAYATIPECLFDFKPTESYHYIIEDVVLGQHLNRTCDYAFRADIANTEEGWAHNVFVRNMCIDVHCDYGVYLTGSATGWMFEGLTVQAYGYVPKSVSAENHQDRKGHRALIKMANVKDIGFYSCYLWDTAGSVTYPAYYSDGGEIVVNGTAKSDEIKNSTTTISCVGCSIHFDVCETYIHKKLNAPENLNIKNLEMSVSADAATGGNILAVTDGVYEKQALIPAATISDEQIDNAVNTWMDDAVIPKKVIGRNKFNAEKNGIHGTHKTYDDYNILGIPYFEAGWANPWYDSTTTMWTTHFIAAEYGDVIRITADGTARQGYTMCCYDAELNFLLSYRISAGITGQPETIDYTKPHVAVQGTAYIRIAFDRNKSVAYPTDENFPQLCITVNDTNVSYEPYYEKAESKMDGLIRTPQLTQAQIDEMLNLLDGYFDNRTSFVYSGASNRNTYAVENNDNVKSAYDSDGKIKLNCSLFAQMVWAGIKAENFVGKQTSYTGAGITKGFDWGYYFKFPWRKFAGMKNNNGGLYGLVKPNADSDIATYSMNTYYSVNGEEANSQYFYTYMTAADMARELKFLGCEVPLNEVMPGDLVFFKAARIKDERLDDTVENVINDGLYMNIDHVAVVTDTTNLSQCDITYCDCSTYWGGNTISDCSISDLLTTNRKGNGAHAADLSNRIVMVARHPQAFGIENKVPSDISEV